MQKDEQGWGVQTNRGCIGAPAAKFWHCPECNGNTPVADWTEGENDSRICPNCKHAFADGRRISEADAATPSVELTILLRKLSGK